MWIEQGTKRESGHGVGQQGTLASGPPPMVFEQLVDALVQDAALKRAIADLLAIKRQAPESEMGVPIPSIQEFLMRELARLESVAPAKRELPDGAVLDRLLFETVTGEQKADVDVHDDDEWLSPFA